MDAAAVARLKGKLQQGSTSLNSRITFGENESREFQGKLETAQLELADVTSRYEAICKLEALDELRDIGDRLKLEQQISSAKARIRGFEQLVAEKNADVASLRNELHPINTELSELVRQEHLGTELAKIKQSIEGGVLEIAQHAKAQADFDRRIGSLRSYVGDEHLVKAAKEAAYSLERAWVGIK